MGKLKNKTIFQNWRKTPVFILVFLSTLICLFSTATIHAESPGDLYPPFDIGAQWNVCQGFDNVQGTHTGASRLGFDLTNTGCDNAASGRVVRAPFTGVVTSYTVGSGSVCVTATDGRSVMLTHIDNSVAVGTPVDNYQVVGTIAAPGQRQNNGVAHLHLQAWSTPRCSTNGIQVPFDSAHRTRICGAPEFPAIGPNTFNNGIWGSTKFIGDACSTTIPPSSPTVYRFYSPITKHHLFTTDVNEMNVLRSKGSWNYEGIAYWVKSKGVCNNTESVYRFYSDQLQVHLYTMDENERAILSTYPQDVWRYEGVSFCASQSSETSTRPVYRFYSDQLRSHLFTADEAEKSELSAHPDTWRYEGISYYVF